MTRAEANACGTGIAEVDTINRPLLGGDQRAVDRLVRLQEKAWDPRIRSQYLQREPLR